MNWKSRYRRVVALGVAVVSYGLFSWACLAEDKPSIQPIRALTVSDKNGNKVGDVLSLQGWVATIALRVDEELLVANVDQSGFVGGLFTNVMQPNGNGFFYESASCAGPPFIPLGPITTSLSPIHFLDRGKLYSYAGQQTTIIVKAQGSGGQCNPVSTPWQSSATPLRLVADLSKEFTPPFTFKAP